MKKFVLLATVCVSLSLSVGCRKIMNAFVPMVHGSGNVVKQDRTVPAFTGVRIETHADVHISQVTDQSIQMSGEDNILRLLHTEVKNGILVISSDKDYEATKPLTINISSPNVESLEVDGSAAIKGETPLHATNFKTEISGSGTMDVDITADKLNSTIEGSGEFTLHGKASEFDADLSGSGTYHAYDLESATASVSINGSGNVEVNCKENLNAEVNGSGEINYKGDPGKVHTNMNGSGSVTKK